MTLAISNYQARSGKPGSPLVGSFDAGIENGLTIKGVLLFEREGKQWIAWPSRQYLTKSGETAYDPHITFVDDDSRFDWQRAVLAAVRPVRAKAETEVML